MVTRTQFWTLRVVVALVTAGFVANAAHALLVWFNAPGS
jgi:hypothetical protein